MKRFKDLLNAKEWKEYDAATNKLMFVSLAGTCLTSLGFFIYTLSWKLSALFFFGGFAFLSLTGVVLIRQSMILEEIKKIKKVD